MVRSLVTGGCHHLPDGREGQNGCFLSTPTLDQQLHVGLVAPQLSSHCANRPFYAYYYQAQMEILVENFHVTHSLLISTHHVCKVAGLGCFCFVRLLISFLFSEQLGIFK